MYHVETNCCCCSVTESCPSLCDSMDCSMPGFPVCHCLPEFAQIYVHWINNVIWPFHPLPPPSPFACNLSQHQCLFSKSLFFTASESVHPVNIQGWLPLGLTSLISLQSKGLSRSLLQNHSLKASVLQVSTFFMVQLLHQKQPTLGKKCSEQYLIWDYLKFIK